MSSSGSAFGLPDTLTDDTTTTGTSLELDAPNLTTGTLLALIAEGGNISGNVLFLGVADGGGFYGNFINCQNNGTPLMTVDGGGGIECGTVQIQSAARLHSGTGAPAFAATVGDLFFRTDATGTADERIYVCTVATGTWVGIA